MNRWWKNELNFSTKNELEKKIKEIKNKNSLEKSLSQDDFNFMIKVFSHHHNFKEKIGCGVSSIELRKNETENGTSIGFWLVRRDKSCIDISVIESLKPNGKSTNSSNSLRAARNEINDQIKSFREKNTIPKNCEICSREIFRFADRCEVDHKLLFSKIFKEFIELNNISLDEIETISLNFSEEFADRRFAEKWKKFHQEKAILRFVHAKCNSLKRKE